MTSPAEATAGPSASPSSSPLSKVDLSWFRMDQPDNRMIITGLLFFEEELPREAMAELIEERLLTLPRFRQRVVFRNGQAHWQDDPDFDLDHHLRPLALPEPGDEAVLQQRVGELMSEPLDPMRPPWAFWLVPYQGGTVLLTRLHHCIGDGVALMLVLLSMTELAPEAGEVNPLGGILRGDADEIDPAGLELAHRILPEVMGLMTRRSDGLPGNRGKLALRLAGTLGKLTFRSADPKTLFKGPLRVEKRAVWSRQVGLDEIREVREAVGGTINDVLLTAMTGALRRYLVDNGQDVDGMDVRAAVPVSIRKLDRLRDLGNQFGLVFAALPVGIADPRARLAELQRRMEALKGSLEAGVVYGLLHGAGHSPKFVHDLLMRIFSSKATAVMTNVPGPREVLHIAGRAITDMLFWVPQAGRLGLGVSIVSYAGRVRLGLATDAGLVGDPETIITAFHEELEIMAALGR